MDFSWSPEQQILREQMRRLGKQIGGALPGEEFPEDAWRRCADAGVFQLGGSPDGDGAEPPDLLTAVAGLEALARETRDNGLLFSIVGQICSAVFPIAAFGSEEQQQEHLPTMSQGRTVGAGATTEAEHGSEVLSLATSYRRDGDDYLLNGIKVFVTSAPVAGLFLVLARDGDSTQGSGQPRLSYFLVSSKAPGLSLGKPYQKMGLNSSPMSEVVLSDCRVPRTARLGKEGAGVMLLQAILEWERITLMACHVGTMERVLGQAVKYARARRQSGRRIIDHQQVGARLADARVALEAGRLMVYSAAWHKQGGRSAPLEAAMAKLFVSESYVQASLTAMQIHGASGYMVELGIEGQVRDALASTIYAGTSEIQRNIIASLL